MGPPSTLSASPSWPSCRRAQVVSAHLPAPRRKTKGRTSEVRPSRQFQFCPGLERVQFAQALLLFLLARGLLIQVGLWLLVVGASLLCGTRLDVIDLVGRISRLVHRRQDGVVRPHRLYQRIGRRIIPSRRRTTGGWCTSGPGRIIAAWRGCGITIRRTHNRDAHAGSPRPRRCKLHR